LADADAPLMRHWQYPGEHMRVHLTDKAINRAVKEAVTAGRCELADTVLPGLRLTIVPPGKKSPKGVVRWVLGCRDQSGAARRFHLGDLSEEMGVAAARKAAQAMREKVRQGFDPIAQAKRTRAISRDAKEGIGTLRAILDAYGGPAKRLLPGDPKPAIKIIGPGKTLKSWGDARRRVQHVFAKHLDRPLELLKASDLRLTADQHPSPQSAGAAVRYIRPVLKWAAERGYCSPEVAILKPPAKVQRRERVLTRDELKAVMAACYGSDDAFRRGVLLLLWTACRRSEVFGGCWGDVDLKAEVWRFPVTKNGQPHTVPLSRQASAFLAMLRPDGAEPDAMVIGKKVANADRDLKRLHADSHTSGWSLHDLRRTVATTAGELGCAPHVIEMMLNHGVAHSAIAAVYNRHRYGAEVADALQLVADLLDGVRTDGAEVVLLKRGQQ
jgi:integrase